MTIRKILTEPDLFLRQKSIKVDNVDDEIRSLMIDMLETMYEAPGIGLAAIQIVQLYGVLAPVLYFVISSIFRY